jgi:hypothetical protein
LSFFFFGGSAGFPAVKENAALTLPVGTNIPVQVSVSCDGKVRLWMNDTNGNTLWTSNCAPASCTDTALQCDAPNVNVPGGSTFIISAQGYVPDGARLDTPVVVVGEYKSPIVNNATTVMWYDVGALPMTVKIFGQYFANSLNSIVAKFVFWFLVFFPDFLLFGFIDLLFIVLVHC